MEDIELNFDLDQDGNFYTNDSKLFDPVRLTVAFYSKKLGVLERIEQKVTKLLGETTQVMLLCRTMDFYLGWWNYPKTYWRKVVGERGWDTWFCNPHDFVGERKRLAVSTGPILKGAFGESFKNMWGGGPYMKVLSIYQVRGREWIVRCDFSWTNFEILISTLSDITATAFSKSFDTCTLNLQVVFSQKGQCTNVIQLRIKVYLNARACICFFCFAKVKKDDYVMLHFTPFMEVSSTLTTQPGN